MNSHDGKSHHEEPMQKNAYEEAKPAMHLKQPMIVGMITV